MKPHVNVLFAPGTNSHQESLRVCRALGATAELLFAEDIVKGEASFDEGDLLFIPGGFCYGDHLGAGRMAGQLLGEKLRAALAARPRPVVAICNGFQIAVRCGLFGHGLDLAANEQGTFCNKPHQEHVVATDNDSLWLRGLEGRTLTFPCAHAEGRFLFDSSVPEGDRAWQVALRYHEGNNPDGSAQNIAGITSRDGLVLGMMDHPERSMDLEVRHAFFQRGIDAVRG